MRLNASSIKIRLQKLERYISELERLQSLTLATFRSDFTAQLAAERAFQAAIESCTDIASHVVSVYNLGRPEVQRDLFRLLADAGYLRPAFADTLGDLVALRNRIVHLYWDMDTERLYDYLLHDVVHLRQFRDFALGLLAAEEEPGS